MSKNEEKKKVRLLTIAAIILCVLYAGFKFLSSQETLLSGDVESEHKETIQAQTDTAVQLTDITAGKNSISTTSKREQLADQLWIMIEGTPAGQTIFLDQFELGLLPASILVEPGFHTVECRKEGYISRTVRVRGNSNHPVNVNCILQKILQKTTVPDNDSIVE